MKLCVHSGTFHCDDVMAIAVLKKLYPDAEVVRTRDQSIIDQCDIVADVGGVYDHSLKRYDHHQEGRAGQRDNGIYYSGIGLVWKHYGMEWCEGNEELFKRIDEGIVMFVDAGDNGQMVYELNDFNVDPVTIDEIVGWFRPAYGEAQDFDAQFDKAVDMMMLLLERYKSKILGQIAAEQHVEGLYGTSPDPRYIVMDEFMPLGDFVERAPELLFQVYPDPSGNWAIKVIRKEEGSFEARKDLPASWAGKRDNELAEITGVDDAVFCHNARFVAAARSKEGALKLLSLALQEA